MVGVREVHVSTREVEAKNAEEAKRKVLDGAGEEVLCEYSHTMDYALRLRKRRSRMGNADDTCLK